MKQLDRVRRVLSRAFDRAARVIAPPSPRSSVGSLPAKHYLPPDSCQIPELSDLYEMSFGTQRVGTVVEVGAFDGVTFSNTSCLIEVGWSAVLMEPVPEFAQQCRDRYRDNPDVRVLEVAAGDVNSTVVLGVAGSLTSADVEQLAEYDQVSWSARTVKGRVDITVQVRRLDDVLDDAGVAPGFEVLVVDVEGYEAKVWDGFDLDRWRPQLMIWELTDTHPDLVLRRSESLSISEQILSHGYRVIYKDHINTVFSLVGRGERTL